MAANDGFQAGDKVLDAALLNFSKSAGDLHGAYLAEMLKATGGEADANDQAFAKTMTRRLAATDLITAQEEKQLNSIVDALYDSSSVAASFKKIAVLSGRIEQSTNASPVAVAVAGIGLNSISTVHKEKSSSKGTSAADLGGALTGANIGSKGGLWGGLLGGIIGGVGASYLASRDEKKAKKGQ